MRITFFLDITFQERQQLSSKFPEGDNTECQVKITLAPSRHE